MALIEVKDLRTYFHMEHGVLRAVDGINFTIEPEETLGMVGESGCGKTTLARIVAAEVGCRPSELMEINGADKRGIDSVRYIIETTRYMTMSGGVRVVLIDEAHRLTSDAQAALLKICEDTPAHVYFILCTTEYKKLLPTL